MTQDQNRTPRAPRRQDVAALIGLLATLEGELLAESAGNGHVPPWAQRLVRRLGEDGLLEPEASERQLRQCLNDLNHRLRYTLGEYDELPSPYPVP